MSAGAERPTTKSGGAIPEVQSAVESASAVFERLDECDHRVRASLMNQMAVALEESRERVVATAMKETSLTEARLQGELDRTASQLRIYAASLLARVEREQEPLRNPERPAIFRTFAGIGPIANFEASNFPLAFGALGTDTASAFAAGCSVVVKSHPAHPRTSEMCVAIARGVLRTANLEDTIGIIHGGTDVARELVQADAIAAVIFTGSPTAGRAIMDLAASRRRPIPVYAEMGSINPIVLTPGALDAAVVADLARLIGDSVSGSAGQLCTKPGVVLVPQSALGDEFILALSSVLAATGPFEFIDERIARQFAERTAEVRSLAQALHTEGGPNGSWMFEHVLSDEIDVDQRLLGEIFGPATIAMRYSTFDQVTGFLRLVGGQLAVALHATETEGPEVVELARQIARCAGRVVWCGVPTGVAIVDAMHHGGPWPSSNSIIGSVGPEALDRFRRPITWQGIPNFALPIHLRATDAC